MTQIFALVSECLIALAIPYFMVTMFLGARVARRENGHLRGQEQAGLFASPVSEHDWELYFLVPCLNEERVIGETVDALHRQGASRIVVVDDGSDDSTADIARQHAVSSGFDDRLIVVSRKLPEARQGKGAALNAAFRRVVADVAARRLDPERVIIAVMDADGRLSANGTKAALARFDNPKVGGVQLAVRIRHGRRLITQFQDVEFWMISALSQFARKLSGTVSLGGNGQFTRLGALLALPGEPWSSSLTEDLDLGLRLVADGWQVTTTGSAYVDQQAVANYRPLLRQRTRWYQGHMTCLGRLPEVWRSKKVGQLALLEVSSYLLVPWMLVLPWSLLQQWVFFELCFGSGRGILAQDLGSGPWRISYALLWYTISFLPNLVIGVLYSRRTRAISLGRSLVLGHLMIAWNYIGYFACWRALVRMLVGRTGWSKTSRSIETTPTTPPVGYPQPLDYVKLAG
jgi:1,2-diacylglycerol 3-beta-glucosyltransferase